MKKNKKEYIIILILLILLITSWFYIFYHLYNLRLITYPIIYTAYDISLGICFVVPIILVIKFIVYLFGRSGLNKTHNRILAFITLLILILHLSTTIYNNSGRIYDSDYLIVKKVEFSDKHYIYIKNIISDPLIRVKCSYNDYKIIEANSIYHLSYIDNKYTGNHLLFCEDLLYE